MAQPPGIPSPIDDLQFNTVEHAVGPTVPRSTVMTCVACHQPLIDRYFAVGDKVICGNCCARLTGSPKGNASLQFATAILYGLGAALLSAVVLYVIYEVGHILIAMAAMGYVVARAMRKGSGGRGGLEYQFAAVALTYGTIVAAYAAIFITTLHRHAPKLVIGARVIFAATKLAIAAPFTGGMENILFVVIIAIAVFQAWKLTAARKLPITGPFQVAPRAPIATISGVQA